MGHPNKISLIILKKRERGRIQELPNFGGHPLLSQEREGTPYYLSLKLRTSNFVRIFIEPIGTKAHYISREI